DAMAQWSQRPEHPDHLAEDLDVRRADRLVGRVLRLQPDASVLAEEPLDGRLVRGLVLADERDDDVTVARVLLAAGADVAPLEVGEMGVDGRRRGEPHLLADLADGGRIAVRVDVLDEELPDLLLALGQQRVTSGWGEHVFESSAPLRTASRRRLVTVHPED